MIWLGFVGGMAIGFVVAWIFSDWAIRKAGEKYDGIDQPVKFALRGLGFLMLPLLPAALAWGLIARAIFG